MELSTEQRDILRHALGYGRRTAPGWRNHFVTGPGTDDHQHCEALVPECTEDGTPICPWCEQPIWDYCRSQYDTMTCVWRPLEE